MGLLLDQFPPPFSVLGIPSHASMPRISSYPRCLRPLSLALEEHAQKFEPLSSLNHLERLQKETKALSPVALISASHASAPMKRLSWLAALLVVGMACLFVATEGLRGHPTLPDRSPTKVLPQPLGLLHPGCLLLHRLEQVCSHWNHSFDLSFGWIGPRLDHHNFNLPLTLQQST